PGSTTTWSSRPTSTNCSGNWSWRASPGRWPRRPESALLAGACGRARFALGLADIPSKGTAMRPSRTIVSLLQLALVIAVPGTLVACGGERASDTDAEATMEDAAPMDDGAAMDQDAGADDGIGAGAEATAVPDWFPQDVYLPADYTVVVARNMGDVQQV